MKKKLFLFGLLTMCILTIQVYAENQSEDAVRKQKVEELAVLAKGYTSRCQELRVLALNAVKNAFAAQSEQKDLLLASLKTGSAEAVRSGRKALMEATSNLDEAVKLAEEIITKISELDSLAAAIQENTKTILSPEGETRFAVLLKKTTFQAGSAAKILPKAEKIAQKLKGAWLETAPVSNVAPSASTTNTLQHPANQPLDAK